MKQDLVLVSESKNIYQRLCRQLGDQYRIGHCHSLDDFARRKKTETCRVALVHIEKYSEIADCPDKLFNRLSKLSENSHLVSMVEPACSADFRSRLQTVSGNCLEIPFDVEKLKEILHGYCGPLAELNDYCRKTTHRQLRGRSHQLLTFTPEMFELVEELKVAAKHDVTLLLIGETGSGKSYLARLIHELSERHQERFWTVACGALPANLIESELFGYVKGAFTGADCDKPGKLAAAGQGTLLLDEIDVLPLEQQTKLLRVIETGEYEPVGSNEVRHLKARLIVASNYDLQDLVEAGTFRRDLYYRLNILNFRLLPLRNRPLDIEYLTRKFAMEHSRAHEITLKEISPEFFRELRGYSWPGNIRELENVIHRAILFCREGVLSVDNLPATIRDAASRAEQCRQEVREDRVFAGTNGNRPTRNPERRVNDSENGNGHPYRQPKNGSDYHLSDFPTNDTNLKTLEARVGIVEQQIIEDSLRRNNHRRKATAAELGISRVTLYNKMKKFGLIG